MFHPLQSSVAFHIETSHLICISKQMTGFHMKRNTGLMWLYMDYFQWPLRLTIYKFTNNGSRKMLSRSNHRWCSVRNIFENFANFTGQKLCWGLFLIKLQVTFINQRLQHRCFPVKFTKLVRTLILKNICRRLLMTIVWNSEKF